MKRDKYYDIAETMYVEQVITEVGIAKRLGISDRTVRRWKAEGDWGEKRKEFINKQTLTNYDMYQLVCKMLDDFNEDLANNQQIDSSRLHKFLNITEEMVKPKPKKPAYANYLMPPPETITVDSTATEVMTTKVSGIMYDKFNPSAILNISGSDYLVRTGDVINGYKILSIGKETVTVQYGSNVYKASVGELFTGNGINFNTVSNLNSKFGSSVNKR